MFAISVLNFVKKPQSWLIESKFALMFLSMKRMR